MLLLGVADEAELQALAERVKGYGYRCWRMETPLFNPANFNRRDDDLFAGRTRSPSPPSPRKWMRERIAMTGSEL